MDKPNYREISTEGFMPVKVEGPRGSAVSMKWLPIDKLRVDPAYQRNISSGGKGNTRQIAKRFSWRKFTPVVVCRAFESEDLYVIIDGQHRTTAAKLIGLTEVPCAIVLAPTVEEQADSFKSINANVTRVTPQDLFIADLASGNEDARELAKICKKADVKIVKSNTNKSLEKGECNSVGTLLKCNRDYGETILLQALNCIVKTGNGNPGLIRPALVKAICKILKLNPRWNGHMLLTTAFENINLKFEFNKAMNTVTDYKTSKEVLLMQAFHPILTNVMGPGKN